MADTQQSPTTSQLKSASISDAANLNLINLAEEYEALENGNSNTNTQKRKKRRTHINNDKSSRSSIINKTATTKDIGPGRYEEIRSSFPLDIDNLFNKKVTHKMDMVKEESDNYLQQSEEKRLAETPRDEGCNHYFKLNVARKIQTPQTPVPPGPDRYKYRSFIEDALCTTNCHTKNFKQVRKVRMGKFFSCTQKGYFPKNRIVRSSLGNSTT